MKNYFKLMRVKHYIKNSLIFLPLVFSGQLFSSNKFISSFLSFLAFSFVASAVYIFNDISDIESDKNHSTKCKRPLAAGLISLKKARLLFLCLISLGFLISFYVNQSILCLFVLSCYLILNMLYSKSLKNIAIADIAILSSGFLLRVLYGAISINVAISSWLYLTVLSMSLYLVLGKRRNEKREETSTRKVLNEYSYEFLDKNMYMFLALTIGFYALWCIDYNIVARYNGLMLGTLPIVMLICMKYSMSVEKRSCGDPVEMLYKDKVLIYLVLLYGVFTAGIIYANYLVTFYKVLLAVICS